LKKQRMLKTFLRKNFMKCVDFAGSMNIQNKILKLELAIVLEPLSTFTMNVSKLGSSLK